MIWRRITYTILAFAMLTVSLQAQAIKTTFGKNRVQYHDDYANWSRYETANFVTYWYGKSKNVAHTVIQIAEAEHDDIQRLLEYRMNDKIEFIVYTDVTDVKQSNLGNEEIFYTADGQIKTMGRKVFVYFDGNHNHLKSQIRQGIAAVYIKKIISGSNLQEVVRNAILLNLPPWFESGLVSYADQSWNQEIDHACRNYFDRVDYIDFEKFAAAKPALAGHTFWYFLESKYGRTKISQIIYFTRIYRNLSEAFPYVLNTTFDELLYDWADYYEQHFGYDQAEISIDYQGDVIASVKKKHDKSITSCTISPNGKYVAYVTNQLGKQTVSFVDVKTGETKRIFKNDFKNPFQAPEKNYPLLAWHPSGESIFILYEKKDIKYLKLQYLHERKEYEIQDIPENYQRIYSMDCVDAGRLLFSGSYDGLSDLFYYKIKSRSTERITEDIWDDLNAQYIRHDGKSGILFESNRPTGKIKKSKLDTILPLGEFNLYFKPDDSDEAIALTNGNQDATQPYVASDGTMIYLKENGMNTRRYIKSFMGSDAPYINSPSGIHILSQALGRDGAYSYVIEDANYFKLYYTPSLDLDATYPQAQANATNITPIEEEAKPAPVTDYDDGRLFQSPEFDDEEGTPKVLQTQSEETRTEDFGNYYTNYYTEGSKDSDSKIVKIEPYRASAARVRFRIFDYSTRLDNEPLFQNLENYSPNSQALRSQPMTIHMSATVKDIFEDYTITGGVRIPTIFNGSEFYLTAINDKKRWDKTYTLYRKVDREIIGGTNVLDRFRRQTLLGRVEYKYPFSIFSSVRLSGTLRLDRSAFQIVNSTRLNEGYDFDKRLGLRAEYVYDNSYDVLTNIKNGTRLKVYLEGNNRFDLDLVNGVNVDLNQAFTGIFGFDARHYIPIWHKSVLAFRGAGAASFGSEQMLYYLGGMEQWIAPKFNFDTVLPQDRNYAYTALAPQLRGFDHNIRNGGSYLLTNTELRIPIFTQLFGTNIKNGFVHNFQLTGFFDAGVAWHGYRPGDNNNPINYDTISTQDGQGNDILVLNVQYFRNPIVYGYGFGARSTLLGYYIKLDVAYGVETGIQSPRKIYLSLGYDF